MFVYLCICIKYIKYVCICVMCIMGYICYNYLCSMYNGISHVSLIYIIYVFICVYLSNTLNMFKIYYICLYCVYLSNTLNMFVFVPCVVCDIFVVIMYVPCIIVYLMCL